MKNYLLIIFKCLIVVLLATVLNSCVEVQDTFRSKKLVSGKGEKFYINSLNWGMTDDYQYTIISKDSTRLKERKDTIGGISGLNPFIYKFRGDTLTILFQKGRKIDVKETFETIELNYISLDNKDYIKLLSESGVRKNGYHLVPDKY